jgi:hypothetical protein
MATVSLPHKLTPLPCMVNMGYEKTGLVHVRHIYSELKYPTLKHLSQIILTTALIEAWHGAFTMH